MDQQELTWCKTNQPTHTNFQRILEIIFKILPKGISAMWNAINLVQNLNSCWRVYFL